MMTGAISSFGPNWWTPPEAAQVAPWGWAPLDDTYEIAIVVDPREHLDNGRPLLARLTYRGALDVAARDHAGLILPSQVAQLQQRGRAVAPVFLPDDAIRSSVDPASILGRRAGETPAEWDQRLRNAGMLSEAWARHHDEVFWSRAGGWEPGELVAGAGKHWVAGAPAGRAWLMGWFSGGHFVQPEPHAGERGFHDDSHHDYATTTILVRRRDGAPLPADWGGGGGPAPAASSAGSAGGGLGLALAIVAVVGGAALAAWHLTTRPRPTPRT